MFAAKSELARHCEVGAARDDDDDAWVLAGDNESVESFLTRAPPSFMDKSWISARHDGLAGKVEEYYESSVDGGRGDMDAIKAAWDDVEDKSLDTLTATLKAHSYGGGKWMLFTTAAEVDAIWRRIVTALWDGVLGSTAKVSGSTPECNGSHVIYVYVDPFWEVSEVERVLRALREECGVSDAIKFKADGVTQLGLSKGNEHGIPPSFYAAARGAVTLSVQRAGGGGKEWARPSAEKGAAPEKSAAAEPKEREKARPNTWVRREAPKPSPRAQPVTQQRTKVQAASAFAALAGVDDDDAEWSTIKQAFRAKALEHHPDKHAGASETERGAAAARFRECQEAFDTLKELHRKEGGG